VNYPTEHQIQSAFVEWCRLNEKRIPGLRVAFAVPNGGNRNKVTASLLKAEGVRPGVPDWMCPARSWNEQYTGLAIEFKTHNGSQSPAQKAYSMLLVEQGWYYLVCRTTQAAINMVEDYFNAH